MVTIMRPCPRHCNRDPACPKCKGLGFVELVAQEFAAQAAAAGTEVIVSRSDPPADRYRIPPHVTGPKQLSFLE